MAIKRILISFLSLLMVFSSWPALGMAASPFPDIKGHYAAEEISQLYEQGIISGYKDGKFYPNREVTRAEFLRMLLETVPVKEWIKGPVPFPQLSSHWAFDDLEHSYRSGIFLDTDWNLVDPQLSEKMTRSEAALLLAAAMERKASTATANPFQDLNGASTKEMEAVVALNQAGIIKGMTDHTYGPDLHLTRGQVSKILVRVQQLQRKEVEQRLDLQAKIADVKGDVKIVTDQGTRIAKVGEGLSVGTEIQTGAQSNATLQLSDGDTLYIDANSRLTIQELDIALQGDKSGELKAQGFKILEEAILLRGKADEKNIGLNWQTDKKVNNYSIFKARNEAVDPSGKPALKGSKSTKWLDTDIEPGHTYHYQVVGATGANEGFGSKEISFEVVKKASFKLWAGNVFAKVKSLFSPSSKFEVQTPTTTAGVRGTSFSISVGKDGKSDVGVYSGAVGLKSSHNSGSDQETIVTPNQQAKVEQGKVPVINPLDLAKTDDFVKNSLAKVILQEQSEQQKLQQQMDQLKQKLDQKLEELKKQLTPQQQPEKQILQKIQEQAFIEKPPVADKEEEKTTAESQQLEQAASDPAMSQPLQDPENQPDQSGDDTASVPPSAPSTSSGGTGGGGSSSTISSIPSVYQGVTKGASYTLPTTVTAKMSDGSTKSVSVTWNPAQVDTSNVGVYTFKGTVSGYNSNPVILKLGVEAQLNTSTAVVQNQPLAFTGGITLDLGAMTIPSGQSVTVTEVSSTSPLPSGFQTGGKMVDFVFDPPITLAQTATISLPMGTNAVAGKTAIYYYDGSNYFYQPTVYENGLLYATVSHFSRYAVLTDTAAPTSPYVNVDSKTSNSVTLGLSAYDNSGIKKYVVYRNGSLLNETVSSSFTDNNVVAGNTYTYQIKAIDKLDNESSLSASISVPVQASTSPEIPTTIKTISGTVYLPSGMVAPVGGQNVYVKAWDKKSDYTGEYDYSHQNIGTTVTIPAGSNSATYSLTVPVNANTYGYGVQYYISPNEYPTSTYVREGYYSLAGTTTNFGKTTPVDLSYGNVSGINLTILTGNSISGTVFLPNNEVAPAGGLEVYLSAYGRKATAITGVTESVKGSTSVVIPQNSNSVDYTLMAPAGSGYTIDYDIHSTSLDNHYVLNGTSAQSIDITSGSFSGANITLQNGNKISGTLSLPSGITSPTGGLHVSLKAYSSVNSVSVYTGVTIPENQTSAAYSLVVPPGSGYDLSYYVYSNTNDVYLNDGTLATSVDMSTGDKTDFNLSLTSGYVIKGTITLPSNEQAPTNGLSIRVYTEGGTSYDDTDYVYMPPGANSVDYLLAVSSGTNYQVHYEILSRDTGGYVRDGYANPIAVSGDVSGINMTVTKGRIISGTLSLPDGKVAPNVGLHVKVSTTNEEGWTDVVIPPNQTSASYAMAVPFYAGVINTYEVYYDIPTYQYPGLDYEPSGYYSSSSDPSQTSPIPVDVSTADQSNINLLISWLNYTDTPMVDGYVDTTTTTLYGTAEAGSLISVYRGEVEIGTATADSSSGAYSVTLSATLAAGDELYVIAKASNKNRSYPENILVQEPMVDSTLPMLSSAVFDQTTVKLTFDETLYSSSQGQIGDFVVNLYTGSTPTAATITEAYVSGPYVYITLANPINNGDSVTVSYNPGIYPIKDMAGNAADYFSEYSVAPANQAPMEIQTLANRIVYPTSSWGIDPIDLNQYLEDPEGLPLEYTNPTSSDTSIATATISGSLLTVSGPGAIGRANIGFTYSDGVNQGTKSFVMIVGQAPSITWEPTNNRIVVAGTEGAEAWLYNAATNNPVTSVPSIILGSGGSGSFENLTSLPAGSYYVKEMFDMVSSPQSNTITK